MLSLQAPVAASDSRSPVYLPQRVYLSPFLLGIRNDLRLHERTFWRSPPIPQMWKLFLVMFDWRTAVEWRSKRALEQKARPNWGEGGAGVGRPAQFGGRGLSALRRNLYKHF